MSPFSSQFYMLLRLLLFGMIGLLPLSGCSRSVVSTQINADGTWKRTVKLYGPVAGPGNAPSGNSLDNTFVLISDPRWQISRHKEQSTQQGKAGEDAGMGSPLGQSEVFTAERMCKSGEQLTGDVAIRSHDSKTKSVEIANEVTVRPLAPNRLEYREVIRWVSKEKPPLKFSDFGGGDEDFIEDMKKALPPALATPAKLHLLEEKLLPEIWRIIFGPNDPFLSEMFSMAIFPDAAEHKLQRRFGIAMDRALSETYGNALTEDQRHSIARRLTDRQTGLMKESVDRKTAAGPPMGGTTSDNSKDNNMISMTFSVRLPGKIVETNGHADPIAGEVDWEFFSPAVQTGEVILHAISETR